MYLVIASAHIVLPKYVNYEIFSYPRFLISNYSIKQRFTTIRHFSTLIFNREDDNPPGHQVIKYTIDRELQSQGFWLRLRKVWPSSRADPYHDQSQRNGRVLRPRILADLSAHTKEWRVLLRHIVIRNSVRTTSCRSQERSGWKNSCEMGKLHFVNLLIFTLRAELNPKELCCCRLSIYIMPVTWEGCWILC